MATEKKFSIENVKYLAGWVLGKLKETLTGSLRVTSATGASETSLELWRSGASWRLLNTNNGILKIQCDYNNGKGEFFDVMTLNYTTGNISVSKGYFGTGNGVTLGHVNQNTPVNVNAKTPPNGQCCIAYMVDGVTKGYSGYTPENGMILVNGSNKLGVKNDGTPHFNGNKLWHAGNDGRGSGLDADMVDGCHASAFVKVGPMTPRQYWGVMGGVEIAAGFVINNEGYLRLREANNGILRAGDTVTFGLESEGYDGETFNDIYRIVMLGPRRFIMHTNPIYDEYAFIVTLGSRYVDGDDVVYGINDVRMIYLEEY